MHVLTYLRQTRPDIMWVSESDDKLHYEWDKTLPRQNEIEGLVGKYMRFGKDLPEPMDIKNKIVSERGFGESLIIEILADLKSKGFDSYKKKHVVLNLFRDVFFYLSIGELAGAIEIFKKISDKDFDNTYLNTTLDCT